MTVELTQYEPRNTWGFVEEGICYYCSVPHELYVNSLMETMPLCTACVFNRFSQSSQYAWADLLTIEGSELSHMKATAPALDESRETCPKCLGLFLIAGISSSYERLDAMNADYDLVAVHRRCTSECRECDESFQDWSRFSQNGMRMMSVENREVCTRCATKIMTEYGSPDDFTQCASCSTHVHSDDTHHFNGSYYCEGCYENNVYYCDECCDNYWSDDGHDCMSSEDDGDGLIHSYSYKPRPFFFGNGSYHLGLELEVESEGNSITDGAHAIVDKLHERVYLKQDGSISDGFEIVTHPHSLAEFQNKFDWTAIDDLRRQGYRSWNTSSCGIHVHVSRTAFGNYTRDDLLKSQSHELRFMKLIYDNENQVSRLAGRTSSFATFEDKGSLVRKVKHGSQHNGRYSAINSENNATLEVRVFRGSLRPARVLSALELVHATVEYTRDLKVTARNGALTWMQFTRFVAEHVESYPNLAETMNRSFATAVSPTNDDN